MELEKFNVNSFIFNKLDSGKGVCIVEYPTKQKQGWYFGSFMNMKSLN